MQGSRCLAASVTTVLVGAVLAVSASGATWACNYGASPPAALKPSLQQGGFTYAFLRCTRFGTAYYAFTDNTFNAKHPHTHRTPSDRGPDA